MGLVQASNVPAGHAVRAPPETRLSSEPQARTCEAGGGGGGGWRVDGGGGRRWRWRVEGGRRWWVAVVMEGEGWWWWWWRWRWRR